MNNPNFLILTEGVNEVTWIANYIEAILKLYEPSLEFKIIKNKREDIISLEENNKETTIYIKKAVNQNLRNFNEYVKDNESFEKIYGLSEITSIFSIFDYDPGSTTDKQCIEYFDLINKQENFYPLMSYPGYESQYLMEFHNRLYGHYSEIMKESHLHNIEEIVKNIMINKDEIKAYHTSDVATKMKKIVNQLKRSKILKEEVSIEKYQRVLEYIFIQFNNKDYFYYLENQEKLFSEIVSDDFIKIISFLNCIIENILEWVRDEEEE